MFWQTLGCYQYEINRFGEYTGWCRCVGGMRANGYWPAWHYVNGQSR